MGILVTGGCGFLGQRLVKELLSHEAQSNAREVQILDVAVPVDNQQLRGVKYVEGDITSNALLESIITPEVKCIYHLAAVLSGAAEENYDLGMKVNLDGTRAVINACRKAKHCPRLVFASSVAVFGKPPFKDAIDFTEESPPTPQSSYGTEKAMCELLIADASRRGFIDGVVVRLPTITVRPGRPNSATSSFVSSIIREPLQGERAVCPVDAGLPLWVQSPRLVLQNLLHARSVDLSNRSRIITLPGITTTPREMLEAVEEAGGDVSLVEWRKDPLINAILSSWPGSIATPIACSLGFKADSSIKHIVQAFMEDDLKTS